MTRSHLITITLALLSCGACLLTGCGAEQKHDYLLDLAPTSGALAVDIENFRGSVYIRADSRTVGARVLGEVMIDEQESKEAEAEAFRAVHVTADLVEQGARSVLKVRSTSDRADKDDHDVALTIDVPRCDGLRIANHGGTVEVVNAGGAIDITNHGGWVEIRTAQVLTDPLTITNVDGPVLLKLPAGTSGRFDLVTLDGLVVVIDRTAGSEQVRSTPGTHTATVNGGASPFVARTNSGDIRLWLDPDPMAMSQLIRGNVPDPQSGLFLQGSRRHTRNLPDDSPEIQAPPQTFLGTYYD